MSTEVIHNMKDSTELSADTVAPKLSPRKRVSERRVVIFVLSLFLVFEVLFWLGGDYLSKDIAHLRSFESISQQLDRFDSDQGLRVLFLGNSLTRYGIDQQVFTQAIGDEFDESVQTIKMNPDNTAIADWFYAYRTYFSKPGITPDVLIIGFEGIHLQDAPSIHPDRLAQYYCSWSDYPKLCKYDLKSFEDRVHFAFCKLSAAFGNRDRVQTRVLDLVIPDYRAGMDQLNERRNRHETTAVSAPSYQRLEELISIAHSQGTQIILVGMPVPEAYQFDAKLLELVDQTSAILVDCRTVPGLTVPMFFDGLHMDPQAAKLYSSELASKSGFVLKSLAQVNTDTKFRSVSTVD